MNAKKSKLLHDMVYAMVEFIGNTVDVCDETDYVNAGIGYWELRYIEIDDNCLIFESNNIHECNEFGEIECEYHKFTWREISDGDKESIYNFLTELTIKKLNDKE